MEAAIALGLHPGQLSGGSFFREPFRVILPPLGNGSSAFQRTAPWYPSLPYPILLATRGRKSNKSKTFDCFEAFRVVALAYLVMTLFLLPHGGADEERMNRGGGWVRQKLRQGIISRQRHPLRKDRVR